MAWGLFDIYATPRKISSSKALDHSAIGFSWYRDGKPLVYALNGHQAGRFSHRTDPFAVSVADSRVERDGTGYLLTIATPTVEGRPIRAEIRFRPADSTESFSRDLGTSEAPHDWILVAADCRVEGSVSVAEERMAFSGRGYHDHNAGAEDLSVAMKRWEWGRVHVGPLTHVYYRSEPHRGEPRALWITCRDGRPETIRESATFEPRALRRNLFGIRHPGGVRVSDGPSSLERTNQRCVDDGPFYLRWLADFEVHEASGPSGARHLGMAEWLETRHLHRFWFNWMIPYRLKRPDA